MWTSWNRENTPCGVTIELPHTTIRNVASAEFSLAILYTSN